MLLLVVPPFSFCEPTRQSLRQETWHILLWRGCRRSLPLACAPLAVSALHRFPKPWLWLDHQGQALSRRSPAPVGRVARALLTQSWLRDSDSRRCRGCGGTVARLRRSDPEGDRVRPGSPSSIEWSDAWAHA